MSVPFDKDIGLEKSLYLAFSNAKKLLLKQAKTIKLLRLQNEKIKDKNKKICNFLAKSTTNDIAKAFAQCRNVTDVQNVIDNIQ